MAEKTFSEHQFTATKWQTAADKAKFANHFVRFSMGHCKETLFPKWFYQRLSMCFGHIAHYDREGFYAVWFAGTRQTLDFYRNVLAHPCYGDPNFTYSDVEKALAQWVDQMGFAAEYQERFVQQVEKQEREELARLQAKYN